MGYDNIFNLIDIAVLCFGIYAMYCAYVLQAKGKIIPTFLLSKDVVPASCKDVEGFARLMGPKLQTLGGVMIVYGGIALLNAYVMDVSSLFLLMLAVFFAVLVWYGIEIKKALKRYF